ncbi:MAG TPA: hypothetical protein PLB97_06885 [Accumulibacter sp.]|jgi:hypothetical protein|nr:hypothetical protein [Accumulibacter sp.]
MRISAVCLILLLGLTGCSDQRAALEIAGSKHSLTLIRTQGFFWEKSAKYAIVATRMPDCMRKHTLGPGSANTRIEVYSPGNDAWILKQGKRMFVVETRTCEGFAKLEAEPEGGMGALLGAFQLRNGELAFVAAKPGDAPGNSAPDQEK